MKKNIIFIFLLAMLTSITSSCLDVGPKWEYLVDNPLNNEITIKIDDKEYKIPANTTEIIKLTQGKHTLSYNGSSANFVTKVNSNKYLTIMNPTLSNYLIYSKIYIKEGYRITGRQEYESYMHEYNSDQGIVRLPIEVLNTLFIDKANIPWTFGLDEDFTDTVSSTSPYKVRTVRKIYRETDYLNNFGQELPAKIVFPKNTKKLNEQPPYVFPAESFISDCDEFNKVAKELEIRWQKMIAEPANIFQDAASLGFDLASSFRNRLNKACSTQYNPNRDETQFEAAFKRLSQETSYISGASTFIVK